MMNSAAVVTGATRNLGLELVRGLAERLEQGDVVYLTGRDPERVRAAAAEIPAAEATVRGETLDVSDAEAVRRFAAKLEDRHGGVDIVFSNHYHRTQPDHDPAQVIDRYVAVNNLGTTNVLRVLPPLLRNRGRLFVVASRAGSLRLLAPTLHRHFDDLATLDDVDRAILEWRDAVRDRSAPGRAWPAWINIPSKIGQVAAVHALASRRRDGDLERGIVIASLSPGLIDTGASRQWLDTSEAATPAEAADALLDFALDPELDPRLYGELVHSGSIVPWR